MIFIDPVDPMLWFTLAIFVGFALLVKILVAMGIMQVTPVNQIPRNSHSTYYNQALIIEIITIR